MRLMLGRMASSGGLFLVFLPLMTFFYLFYGVQNPANFVEYRDILLTNKTYNDLESDMVWEENVKDGYIVWNPSCRIPNISAFHQSIHKLIHKWVPLTCSKNRILTGLVFNQTSRQSTLKIIDSAISDYGPISKSTLQCCYQRITRNVLKEFRSDTDDDRYQLSRELCFFNKILLPAPLEYLYVYCRKKGSKAKLYENLHSIVVEKDVAGQSRVADQSKANDNETLTKYSVLLFGIDSISRLSFHRTMPQTREFLEKEEWISLEGYNKIADNTFPNLMAILSGLTVNQLREVCFKNAKQKLDDCPLLWKNFSQQGYLTTYAEDEAHIGTFNYHKYGFLNSPTDYYTRPYMIFGAEKLKLKRDGGMNYCMGSQPQAEYLFQYISELVQRLHQRLYFNLGWFNSFSHNDVNMPSVMDVRIRRLLQDIQPYLNSTVVLFFSDHGVRFGPIRETYIGWLEERLPFMYLWIPPSFRQHNPAKYANLMANRNRLTSPFDVHATLQDILYGEVRQPAKACPTCDSLFSKAVWNRSCEDAAIPAHWCTCSVGMDDSQAESVTQPVVVGAANGVVQHINGFLAKHKAFTKKGFKCAVLALKGVLSVRTVALARRFSYSKALQYVIVFQVQPGGGLFEATWSSHGPMPAMEDISRINMYGNQSSCVTGDSELKKYCFCI